ncbi:type II secretion system protein [Gemella sanguinis]|jgi:general secretion pathway protein, pilin family|uniref:type II secretion system protein n=1 Tax=Gemella sanguinis TaxID=84135 RepID=UPI0028E33BFE|nr:type II secretion system protein [Gemella sanguinis]
MKSRNNGFTFIEIMAALFICSLIFVYLIPNMVKQYSNLSKAEKELEMRELLYEEISNHKDQKYFKVRRESYVIIVSGNRAEIYDEKTRNKIKFG